MPRRIFINLPVADLERSVGFFESLGFENDPRFTDDTAACMVVSDAIHAMLLTHDKFRTFTPNPICDARERTEVLLALSCASREEVDDLVQRAVAAGGRTFRDPQDHGFMYEHAFQDPDGHVWELAYADPDGMPVHDA